MWHDIVNMYVLLIRYRSAPMTKITVLFAGLLALAACQTSGQEDIQNFNGGGKPLAPITNPTDGIATGEQM